MTTRTMRAENYEQARPPYAADVAAFVARALSRTDLDVVDIGCGTGLSTAAVRSVARRIIAVEPDSAMRAVAELSLAGADVPVRDGSAERTGLDDHSIDLIVAASCFEWFHLEMTNAEWRRVLRSDGHVLLMWNHRAAIDDPSRAWERLWIRHVGPRLGPDREDIELALVPGFSTARSSASADCSVTFRHHRVRRFVLSSAHARRLTGDRWEAVERDIHSFLVTHGDDGSVTLAFETVAYLGSLH